MWFMRDAKMNLLWVIHTPITFFRAPHTFFIPEEPGSGPYLSKNVLIILPEGLIIGQDQDGGQYFPLYY
jgi:hypothetical protein